MRQELLAMSAQIINGLPLPPLFLECIRDGRWRHPGDKQLQRIIPFFHGPVDFLSDLESMRQESSGKLADIPQMAEFFYESRGSASDTPVLLPWLDADQAVFIAANRISGDDIGIAPPPRSSRSDPRVVANDWHTRPNGCLWREVAPTFSAFLGMLSAIGVA